MRKHFPRAALFAITLAVAACIPLPGGYSLSSKVVSSKAGPSTLYADDGSFCKVTDPKFAEAIVGDLATCAWGKSESGGGDVGGTSGVPGVRRPPITSKPPR